MNSCCKDKVAVVTGAGGNNVKAMPARLRFCEKDLEVDFSNKEHKERKDFVDSVSFVAENNSVNPVNPVKKYINKL